MEIICLKKSETFRLEYFKNISSPSPLILAVLTQPFSFIGGRNFESFSEDPFLTGKLAAAYINGLQGKGIAATIKRKDQARQACHVSHANFC